MYFSIESDKQFPRFCQACLVGKAEAEMSNKRLCMECQSHITEDDTFSHPESHRSRDTGCTKTPDRENHGGKTDEVLVHTELKESNAQQNPTEGAAIRRGGRPKNKVPLEIIHKLSDEGLGVQRIARELKQQGETVSAMTFFLTPSIKLLLNIGKHHQKHIFS